MSARVELRAGERVILGWALNSSRDGLRAVIEEQVELGDELDVTVGDAPPRRGRVVWLQDERDGAVIGLSFLEPASPSDAPPPSLFPPSSSSGDGR